MIIIIFVVVVAYGLITTHKYNDLKRDYIELEFSKNNTIDSLLIENDNRLKRIEDLEVSVENLQIKQDSLKNIKSEVLKEEFKISNDISEGVELLKQNLLCVEL